MYIREKISEQIMEITAKALDKAVASGAFAIETMPDLFLEIPREKEHGEYSTNIAMQLPKQTRKPPRFIAAFPATTAGIRSPTALAIKRPFFRSSPQTTDSSKRSSTSTMVGPGQISIALVFRRC